jgi:nicotinamide-nucleotide amidase
MHTLNYLQKYANINSLILGISGGIDSALAAILAYNIINSEHNIRDIKLHGRFLNIYNGKDENDRANKVGDMFCDSYSTENLEPWFESSIKFMFPNETNEEIDMSEKIRRGNIRARLRMIYLMDLAHRNNGMVLSTDNYTEYMLGFWTLHGDVGNFGMFQNLWKTEIYGLANWLVKNNFYGAYVLKSCIDAIPTDGLGITSSDFDQMGGLKSYTDIDNELLKIINFKKNDKTRINNDILNMSIKSNFKRSDPYNIPRKDLIRKLIL